jgi:hypothetical protein
VTSALALRQREFTHSQTNNTLISALFIFTCDDINSGDEISNRDDFAGSV